MLIKALQSGQYAVYLDESPSPRELVLTALDELGKQTGKEKGCYLVPAEICPLRAVCFSRTEKKLLSRTVPFALEESLLDKIEETHFALGKSESGLVPVAVIKAQRLQELLKKFANCEMSPDQFIPEVQLLPLSAGRWTVLLDMSNDASEAYIADDTRCVLRTGEYSGFGCSFGNLGLTLQTLLNESESNSIGLEILICQPSRSGGQLQQEQLVAAVIAQLPALLRSDAKCTLTTYWRVVKLENAAGNAVNLLQGRFEPAIAWHSLWKRWQTAAVLVLAIALADLGLAGIETVRLQNQTESLIQDQQALYRSVIPNGVISDMELQLRRQVDGLTGSSSSGFLTLLAAMAPGLQQSDAVTIQSLSYQSENEAVDLLVATSNFAEAEALRASLENSGLQAELLGSSRTGMQSQSRLRVREVN